MTVRDFLTTLESHPELELAFDPGSGPIAPGYHVTEFKSATVRAIDCGVRSSRWQELILQLVPPARPEPRGMTASKFLAIWRRVERAAADESATVRVETPTAEGVAVSHPVERIDVAAGALTVHLAAPAVACKGNDRSVGDIPVLASAASELPVAGCCAPAPTAARTGGGACRD